MSNKISVITVVFNDVANIRATMESFFSQTWEDKEYIVIDGGSTDGTAEIIKEYADRLAYWCSEKDGGIYDAMNKGIMHATGDWINILNCGDYYCSEDSLRNAIIKSSNNKDADIIYGNSIAIIDGQEHFQKANTSIALLDYKAIYRHGSSLVRTRTNKKYMYNTNLSKKYGFALDFDAIYRMYHAGCTFFYIEENIQKYSIDGVSNNMYKSLLYNLRITTQYKKDIKKIIYFIKNILSYYIKQTYLFKWIKYFIFEFIVNDILPHIPSWTLRRFFFKSIGINIGKGSFVMKKNYIMTPRLFHLGKYSHINRNCLIDARGGIEIGNSVSISHNVNLVTGGHNVNSHNFSAKYLPIRIEDYVWIGIGSTILQGITIGKGAVVCAGAVVTKDIPPFTIVAGVPAKPIGFRNKDLKYECKGNVLFT